MEKERKMKQIQHPASKNPSTDTAWAKLHKRLDDDGLLMEQPARRNLGLHSPLVRVAAVIILLLAIGGPALWLDLRDREKSEEEVQHFCGEGVSTVDLPDGSRVFLNQGSEITYPASFGQERSVKLKGEGFFEVMSNPASPFIVYSGRVAITALGTSFNVKEGASDKEVEVLVKSGKVRMSMEEQGNYLTLEPGDMGQSTGGNLQKIQTLDPNYLSWKTRNFKFVDNALNEVLSVLEQSYHIKIHCQEVDTGELRITSSYREQSADAIMETIAAAFGLNLSREGKEYYLSN